jgi:hypothetical protein
MQVAAKCVVKTWESKHAFMFDPGAGPLPGGLYEIDRDGPLASLKSAGRYVFDFDRNAGPDDKPHDYSCKREGCGKKFKTLSDLGTHTREFHKDVPRGTSEPDEEVVVAVDGRGKKKGKTFSCKTPGCGVTGIPNLYALKLHKKTHEKDAVAVAA